MSTVGYIDLNSGAKRFYLKEEDTARPFRDVLALDGTAINLSSATVFFLLKNTATGELVKSAATITDAANGLVEFTPLANQVDAAGVYRAEWEIQFTDGSVLTLPSDSHHIVHIVQDLG